MVCSNKIQLHVALVSKPDQVHSSHVDLGLRAVVQCGYPHSDVSCHSDVRLNLSLSSAEGDNCEPTPPNTMLIYCFTAEKGLKCLLQLGFF